MLMLSCGVAVICVTVRVACTASVCRASPRTLALDRKSESHSALSPGARGGILVGGVAGSNVRFAIATGCLLIVGTGASLCCRRDEKPRHVSQPKTSTPSNTQSTIEPRKGNSASAFHFPNKNVPEPWVCGWRMTRKVLSGGEPYRLELIGGGGAGCGRGGATVVCRVG